MSWFKSLPERLPLPTITADMRRQWREAAESAQKERRTQLRNQFACHAMQGLLASSGGHHVDRNARLAALSFEIADAMIVQSEALS